MRESRALPYIAPFLLYVALLAVEKYIPLSPVILYTARIVIVTIVVWVLSRQVVSFRVVSAVLSVIVGLIVFVIWVGPDLLIYNYREHWLFRNPLTGAPVSSLPGELKESYFFLIVRSLGSLALVPVIEELFWRAWMMRWLINSDFEKVPLGTYQPFSFFVVALLFAAEHGPYWEVGLLAGLVYNWWMVRTKSLGDCILAHAVTNAVLAAYVIFRAQWQYWL
jgi:CAAX prenyl protease-like protein